jgi:hypothetical protein
MIVAKFPYTRIERDLRTLRDIGKFSVKGECQVKIMFAWACGYGGRREVPGFNYQDVNFVIKRQYINITNVGGK